MLGRLRGAAAVGSPAHFFNLVFYRDNPRRAQVDKGLKFVPRGCGHARGAGGVVPPGARERPAVVRQLFDCSIDPRSWSRQRQVASELRDEHNRSSDSSGPSLEGL